MSWSDCVAFVDVNKKQIAGQERKYSAFSPYDVADFMQEAYICAYNASKLFPVGTPSFLATFWKMYREVSWHDLAINPSMDDVINFEKPQIISKKTGKIKRYVNSTDADPASRKPVEFISFQEDIHSNKTEPLLDYFAEPPIDIHRTLIQLTKHLLAKQKEVFITVLGLKGKGGMLNLKEAADQLGRDQADVFKNYNRACARLGRLVEEGKIDVNSFPRTILVAINGGKSSFSSVIAKASTSIHSNNRNFAAEYELKMVA